MNCKVCENTSAKNTSVSFFRFPKDNKRCKDWAKRCDLLKSYLKHGTLTFYMSFRICSDHFDPKDIIFDGRKKRLLQSAVPQYFLKRKSIKDSNEQSSKNFPKVNQVHNLCRLCAEEANDLTDIFGSQGQIMNLETKLKYFPLVVNKYDALPLKVCHQCISKVDQFSEFINNCMRAENKLKVMLDTQNVSDEKSTCTDSTCLGTIPEQVKVPNSSYPSSESPVFLSESVFHDGNNKLSVILNLSDCYITYSQPESDAIQELDKKPLKQNAFNAFYRPIDDLKYDIDLTEDYTGEHFNSNTREQFLQSSASSSLSLPSSPSITIRHQNEESEHHMNLPLKMEGNATDKSIGRSTEFKKSSTRENGHSSLINSDPTFLKCQKSSKNVSHREAFNHDQTSFKTNTAALYFYKFRPFECPDDTRNVNTINSSNSNNQISKIVPNGSGQLKRINEYSKKSNNLQFACRFCDKIFKTSQLCKSHQNNIHAKATCCQCKLCGKVFRSKSSLRQHRSVHSDKRLFSCTECSMSFKRKDTLSNHLRIHTGERPFVCKVCGFAFKQRGDCSKHEKNHTNREINKMDECKSQKLGREEILGSSILTESLSSNSRVEFSFNEEKTAPALPETILADMTSVPSSEAVVDDRFTALDFSFLNDSI